MGSTRDTNFVQLTIMTDDKKSKFKAPINPESYKQNLQNSYSTQDAVKGNAGKRLRFVGVEPQTVSFDLMLDDTGVIYDIKKGEDIVSRITQLKKIVYNYQGEYHSPNQLILDWSKNFLEEKMQYRWRLESMSISFTLFAPDGRPLRAKISLSFKQSLNLKDLKQLTNDQSPDMTHYRHVQEGDTLPMMCYKIYQDETYYLEVARVNQLINFRYLRPGLELFFPPIQDTEN